MIPPLIALEEHFMSNSYISQLTPDSKYIELLNNVSDLREKLADLGPLRLANMEKGKISVQIVSHAAQETDMTPEQAEAANNQLAQHIKVHPDRLAGFGVLAISQPASCATELIRCVRELGFVGALIDNHTANGTYFDGDEYLPMFQAAVDLDVPIYLHPTWPTDQMVSTLYEGDNISLPALRSISASGWGWHSDVGSHILRLFAAGLFDKLPRLKIVIGHMGEMIPFMLGRILLLSKRWSTCARDFKTVWEENIWVTTSGNWSLDPLACILRNTPIDHVLFSVDYPFANNESGLALMEALESSGLVDEAGFAKICYKNSETLFGVKATKRFE